MIIYKTLVLVGCLSLIIAGIITGFTIKSFGLAFANICVGLANIVFMLR